MNAAGSEPVTPQNDISNGEALSPNSGSSSEPLRFRSLNEVYEDTVEIELAD